MNVTIVGAGLSGSLLAAMLSQRGHHVELFERRTDPRVGQAERGRSINLALSARGLNALSKIGAVDAVLATAIPMRGRMIHDVDGSTHFHPYSKNKEDALYSVSRLGLNMTMLEIAEKHENVSIKFDHRCTDVDLKAGKAQFVTGAAVGGSSDSVISGTIASHGEFIIGTDGAFSAVRQQLQRQDRFDYRQDYLQHGYKELVIPAQPDGSFALEPNALHIWPRGYFMMIALPNQDGSFTCTIFWPFEGPHSFAALKTVEQVRSFFAKYFADAVPLMPTLEADFLENPIGSLVTVRCGPWFYEDKVVLAGDACHAVVPFYGQGMNAAFEDCVALMDCLESNAADRAAAFSAYYQRRKPHVDALADLAIGNFYEMRDRVASKWFVARKKFEHALAVLFPFWYRTLYSMISFSTTPYADAVARARYQNRVVLGVGLGVLALGAMLMLILI